MIVATRPLAYAALCIAMVGALSACGKPENDGAAVNALKTPLPPYPAWSVAMIGKPLASVVHGKADCMGVFDDVLASHAGAKPGSEVGGWAWDKTAKKGVQHILIVDLDDHIIGAAEGGLRRPDVPPNMPGVTSEFVGWRGVTEATTGTALAVGLAANGGQCALAKAVKLDGAAY
jgi:hypothetical protein